ncbi:MULTISPECIES: LysR family transcriptional regulator [unclassified Rhodococcus (in: high G+C Gram-positive bacteria)]|uniref:LysR family transcriptional regulator n=1 Tax=unclassified Rhodococcus (in: high G+C Gram-positive bacteria) TaxID=192944 RepID=UPI00146D1EA5|nr:MULTISPECIES: LysR family transcriptional regulator [unclassified Rhodococcus (in: high G+C Gram-positive bacteria)]NMD94320.1 LysR family transcriptional regulator [Rhodococcus sp. BL-253-APC-6A1W]NME78524.1 LysR family transcriptional regulator [Rhodococcus sp. 105337]
MLDVRKLRLLRELAHRGTIAAVAEALSYTPSAVSQQISALEREAGRPLLVRTGRRVRLTPAALILVEHTEAVLAELERAETALATSGPGPSGSVRLGAFPTALRTVVLPALSELRRAEQGPEVTVTEVDPADAPDLLRGGHLDMALVHEYDNVPSSVGSGIELEPLLDEVIYLAASAAPDAEGLAVVRSHADSPWIVGNSGTLCHTMAVRTCRSQGFEPWVTHRVDDFATVLRLVAAGAGVALVPQLGAIDVPAGVVLTALPVGRRTRIAYRRGSGHRPAQAVVSAELRRAARSFDCTSTVG